MDYRKEIIETGIKMVKEGLVASTWGNISVKVDEECFYITPSGMEYENLKIDDLVLININGKIIEGKRKPSSEMIMHLEIYKNRKDVKAVVHTHSLYASAYSVAHKPIPPIIEDLVQVVGGTVDVAEYALPGTEELAKNVVKALKDKNGVLLANHGVLGTGVNLGEAYKACRLIEKTACIGIAAKNLGMVYELSEEDIKLMRKLYLKTYGQK